MAIFADDNNASLDIFPNELKLQILSYLDIASLKSASVVNNNLLSLSENIFSQKLRDEFCLPNHDHTWMQADRGMTGLIAPQKLFYNQLSAELAGERKLFVAYQQAFFLEKFLNTNCHLDSYYLFTTITLKSCWLLEKNMQPFTKKIQEMITFLATASSNKLKELQNGLDNGAQVANALFDKLLSAPQALSSEELNTQLISLVKLDAKRALLTILKKNVMPAEAGIQGQLKPIDLTPLLTESVATFNLGMIKKLVELGADIHANIPIYEGITDSYLTYFLINLSEGLFTPLSTFGNSFSQPDIINAPGLAKAKEILDLLLSYINLDQIINVQLSNGETGPNTKNVTCRKLAKWFNNYINEQGQKSLLDEVAQQLVNVIFNYPRATNAMRMG